MHEVWPIALRVLSIAAAFATFVALLVFLVRKAKRGKSFQAVGAALMLFGWGNLRDPGNDPVKEAQEGRIRKGNESGDPL